MKSTENILYKESQNFTLVNVSSITLTVIFIILYFLTGGIKKIPISIFIFVVVFLLTPIILFFKMDTKLTNEKLKITFGVGLIKKTFKTNSLNFSTVQQSKIPWYYGVGIRIAKDGIVYNSKPGSVIKIQKRDSKKHIYIGTRKQEEFIETCKTIELSKIKKPAHNQGYK